MHLMKQKESISHSKINRNKILIFNNYYLRKVTTTWRTKKIMLSNAKPNKEEAGTEKAEGVKEEEKDRSKRFKVKPC